MVTPPALAMCRGGLEGHDLPHATFKQTRGAGSAVNLQRVGADDRQIGAASLQPAPGTRGCGRPRASLATRGCSVAPGRAPELPRWVHSLQSPMGTSGSPALLGASPHPAHSPSPSWGEKREAATRLGQTTRVPRPVPAVSFSHFPSMRAAGLPAPLSSAPAILSSVSPAPAMHFPSPFDISPLLRHCPVPFWGLGSRGRAVPHCCYRVEPGPSLAIGDHLCRGAHKINPACTDKRSAEQAGAQKLSLHQQPRAAQE